MSRLIVRSLWALTLMAGGTFLACTLANCASTTKPAAVSANGATTQAAATAPAEQSGWALAAPHKGGAQLWAETCSRCHNVRSPSAYSSDQWQVILHDMRIRGQLTGQEQRQILEFLKSSH